MSPKPFPEDKVKTPGEWVTMIVLEFKNPISILGEVILETGLEDEMDFNRQKRGEETADIPEKSNDMSRDRDRKVEIC